MKTYKDLFTILEKISETTHGIPNKNEVNNVSDKMVEYLLESNFSNVTVVGLDIYKYSEFKERQQSLIPFLFDFMRNTTITCCLDETYLFQNITTDDLENNFIPTGDGGFQILKNPIQALLFIAYFQANLHLHNTYKSYPLLREFIGPISIRFAITHSSVFKYENNIFGDAIISNARILSKDKLNRCLVDENVYRWFENETNGIETFEKLKLEELKKIKAFIDYDHNLVNEPNNLIINKSKNNIDSIICSKIGNINAKSREISIYNLYYKTNLRLKLIPDTEIKDIVVSVGNTNVNGLD